jgi:hypothetical protein
MKRIVFGFKIEDLVPIGNIVRVSYARDRAKFIEFSTHYDGNHLDEYDRVSTLVNDCINPKVLTSRMKESTEKLHAELKIVNAYVASVQRYTEMTGEKITLSAANFGFSVLRKKCRNLNTPGVIKNLTGLKQMLEPWMPALTEVGYTSEKLAEIDSHIAILRTCNTAQKKYLNQRIKQVQDNVDLLNGFWATINDILKTGKILFANDAVTKKEYTQSAILKQIRHNRNKNDDDSDDDGGTGKSS